jgi:hypothetical protein
MSMTVDTGTTLDEGSDRRRELLAELREVEHWRRLVRARLDLAVAAVTAIDEPVVRHLPPARPLPWGMRAGIGLPACSEAVLQEAAALPRLRALLGDLDVYAAALRGAADEQPAPGHAAPPGPCSGAA